MDALGGGTASSKRQRRAGGGGGGGGVDGSEGRWVSWRSRAGCHGLAGVTGVRLHPWGAAVGGAGHGPGRGDDGAGLQQQQQQQQQSRQEEREVLVTSTGVDGEVKCWRMCADARGLQVSI